MENETEIWKDVPGYEGYYRCSNLGRIEKYARKMPDGRNKPAKLMKTYLSGGYPSIKLQVDKNSKSFRLHRIIAMLFVPNPNNLPYTDHIDMDKGNYAVSNLEWVSHKENLRRAFDSKTLDDIQNFIKIKVQTPDGEVLTYRSIAHTSRGLEEKFGRSFDKTSISKASLNGKSYSGCKFWREKGVYDAEHNAAVVDPEWQLWFTLLKDITDAPFDVRRADHKVKIAKMLFHKYKIIKL